MGATPPTMPHPAPSAFASVHGQKHAACGVGVPASRIHTGRRDLATGYRAPGPQGPRATGLQGYRATGLQGYRAPGLQAAGPGDSVVVGWLRRVLRGPRVHDQRRRRAEIDEVAELPWQHGSISV